MQVYVDRPKNRTISTFSVIELNNSFCTNMQVGEIFTFGKYTVEMFCNCDVVITPIANCPRVFVYCDGMPFLDSFEGHYFDRAGIVQVAQCRVTVKRKAR